MKNPSAQAPAGPGGIAEKQQPVLPLPHHTAQGGREADNSIIQRLHGAQIGEQIAHLLVVPVIEQALGHQ